MPAWLAVPVQFHVCRMSVTVQVCHLFGRVEVAQLVAHSERAELLVATALPDCETRSSSPLLRTGPDGETSSRRAVGPGATCVAVGVASHAHLIVRVGFGVLAILPGMQPESTLQRFGHGRILL